MLVKNIKILKMEIMYQQKKDKKVKQDQINLTWKDQYHVQQ